MTGHALPRRHRIAIAASVAAVVACHRGPPPEPFPETVPAEYPVPLAQADTVSEQDVLTEGRKVFHGPGLCFACHGGRLQGGPVAPPLAGPRRNLADTSFAHILRVIRAGEPHSPMVANQGGIDAGQVVQVANYVWAVSNGKSVP
jgi:mono/diheme cytochrome c family protein